MSGELIQQRGLATRDSSVDLLADFSDLAASLFHELESGSHLDAFLLAAGMSQILEDHLHREPIPLSRLEPRMDALPHPLGRVLGAAARGAAVVGESARLRTRKHRRLMALQPTLAGLTQELATLAVDDWDGTGAPDPPTPAGDGHARQRASVAGKSRLLRMATRLTAEIREHGPEVCGVVAKHPTSFRSLDQQPADLQRIVGLFSERYPDRARPLLLVGIRTSGGYLVPLYAAYLRRAGYRDVGTITMRPDHALLDPERRRVQGLVDGGGLLLVADDPPKSGATLRDCVADFEQMGVPRGSTILLLTLLGDSDSLPSPLAPLTTILLPFRDWSIHDRLSPSSLLPTLRRLLVGRTVHLSPAAGEVTRITVGEVVSVTPVPLPPVLDLRIGSPLRRHLRALVRVQLREAGGERSYEHHVYVKGVGLGYFGRHSKVLAESLNEFFPELYGVQDGLLFRSWMPELDRVREPGEINRLADRIGSYVAARSRALAVEKDASLRTGGVRRQVARLIEPSFGRFAVAFRPLVARLTDRLVRVERPSVIDGSMSLNQWFETRDGAGTQFWKVDYDERAFANQDAVVDELHCYDAVYDLAGASVDHAISYPEESLDARFDDALLAAFERESRRSAPAERWFLYQLVHARTHIAFLEEYLRESRAVPSLTGAGTLSLEEVAATTDTARRALARFEQSYLARLLLSDVAVPSRGPLCAIDIDGVLETSTLGYSSCTPLGVLCLRALACHGYRPVLVTGRSLGEVKDRCTEFRLAGAVAEYGAVIYDHARGQTEELLASEEREGLEGLRRSLMKTLGVHVNTGYRRAVRASIVDSSGRRQPLPGELVTTLLAHHGLAASVQAYPGYAQTDFMIRRTDKALGVAALAERLPNAEGRAGKQLLAFAIGDTLSDLPLLMLASQAFAPKNAESELQEAGVHVMPGQCQAGLAQAVDKLLGHRPGGCPRCAAPPLRHDSELLLGVLSAQSLGRRAKLAKAAELAQRVLRP